MTTNPMAHVLHWNPSDRRRFNAFSTPNRCGRGGPTRSSLNTRISASSERPALTVRHCPMPPVTLVQAFGHPSGSYHACRATAARWLTFVRILLLSRLRRPNRPNLARNHPAAGAVRYP